MIMPGEIRIRNSD